MNGRIRLAATALALLPAFATALELRPGQPLEVQIPAGSFTQAIWVEVPTGAERLQLNLDGANPAQDVDLLARFGEPFPATSFTDAPPQADWLWSFAHFQSVSPQGTESIVISRASPQPLRAGRLHLALINYSASPATATLSASFASDSAFVPLEVSFNDSRDDCDISGWNDSTPAAPVRGNSGTTLGQQRRLALQEAARLLGEELRPRASIRIQACWENQEFGENGGVLAQARPNFLLVDDPGLDLPFGALDARYVTQTAAVAAHQAGTPLCRFVGMNCGNGREPDVRTSFNRNVDSQGDASRRFDYGFQHAGTGFSFVSTAMHEIAHGLGFIGLLNLSESAGNERGNQRRSFGKRYDDAYGRHAVISGADGSRAPLLRATREERLAALVRSSALGFAGPRSLQPPNDPLRLHAPNPISEGSSYSHLNSFSHPGLMTASISSTGPRALGTGRQVLYDVGWDPAPKPVPAPATVREGQYYDVARNGHGFDLRRIEGLTGADELYFVLFYTFDAQGRPEWFSSAGRIIDGVFQPARSATGDSLLRNLYQGQGAVPSTIADPSPDFHGDLRIDFRSAALHPECADGRTGRALAGPLAVMSWDLDGNHRQWCVQPVVDGRDGVAVDFSNQWYDPSDGGWGLSVQSFPGAGGDGLAIELYFPDAGGRGRWGLVQTDRFVPGASYPVWQVGGYCRTCIAPAELGVTPIGTLSIDLAAPGEGTSRVSIDVSYPGPEGGRFMRNDVPIVPVGVPGYRP
jgi:hypothetical protein